MKVNAYQYPEGGYVESSRYMFASEPPPVNSQRSGMESTSYKAYQTSPVWIAFGIGRKLWSCAGVSSMVRMQLH